MLNEKLFDNKKDAKIADLTLKIEAFKRYDEKRKEYYRKALIRLGEAEEILDSMEADDPRHALKGLVKAKNAKIHELQNKFSVELLAKDKEINNLKSELYTLDKAVSKVKKIIKAQNTKYKEFN